MVPMMWTWSRLLMLVLVSSEKKVTKLLVSLTTLFPSLKTWEDLCFGMEDNLVLVSLTIPSYISTRVVSLLSAFSTITSKMASVASNSMMTCIMLSTKSLLLLFSYTSTYFTTRVSASSIQEKKKHLVSSWVSTMLIADHSTLTTSFLISLFGSLSHSPLLSLATL